MGLLERASQSLLLLPVGLGLFQQSVLKWHFHFWGKLYISGSVALASFPKWHYRQFPQIYLFRRKSQLSLSNKILLYKTILNPIWTYGIQLFGTASTSNVEILERFQSKVLRQIVDAPWYVPKTIIRRDLHMPTVKEEIRHYSSHYSLRLSAHPNELILHLLEPPEQRRLRRFLSYDLPTIF
jgi:hypothetical protein